MRSIAKKEREDIFRLFLHSRRLKFSEIEKRTRIRSNMVAYHLEQMRKERLLEKDGEAYKLTSDAERYIPVFTHLTGEELSPLPVVLVAPVRKGKVLLIKREKRPYDGHWGLIGGKMLLEEDISDACERKMREHYVVGRFKSLHAIAHERVREKGKVKHGFVLLFASASADSRETDKKRWFTLRQLRKEKIIPSDLWLIENRLKTVANIDVFSIEEESEGLNLTLN